MKETNDLCERVLDIENDLRALFKHLGVVPVDFKQNRTGDPSHPWTYGRKIIKAKK